MRIAHIITRMIVGGAQENTLLCCQDLVRIYGDDVLLVTGPSLGPEGSLFNPDEDLGVTVREIPQLRRAIHPWRDFSSYLALKRILREFKPDVVHTHSAKGGMLGRMSAKAINVPAIIHTVHGAPFHPYQSVVPRTFFQWCERYAARKCHKLVSVADAMTDLLVEANIAPLERFSTVYSGMDVEPFLNANHDRQATRKALGFNPDHIVIGKIARLFHLKGHEYLIAAARAVVEANPKVRFLLVGDGILRERLKSEITAGGLRDHFYFTGLVPPARIPALLGAMDILVHTSLREGLARTLPQALIAGKPVVSYDVHGAREVVISGETGYLIPPKTVQPLVDAMIELSTDESLRKRLGQQGQERFTDQFRHEMMTRQLREIYEQVMAANDK